MIRPIPTANCSWKMYKTSFSLLFFHPLMSWNSSSSSRSSYTSTHNILKTTTTKKKSYTEEVKKKLCDSIIFLILYELLLLLLCYNLFLWLKMKRKHSHTHTKYELCNNIKLFCLIFEMEKIISSQNVEWEAVLIFQS